MDIILSTIIWTILIIIYVHIITLWCTIMHDNIFIKKIGCCILFICMFLMYAEPF